MAEPYRWGSPPPAGVQYRRARAAGRVETAVANWHLEKMTAERPGLDLPSSIPSLRPELTDTQTEERTS